ncbi:MAG: ATP-grasp domain-containing protein [Acidobacteria bacterium]|nr:ATP-grasp domain-containing protein [Acidobacteriota bacterium]
MNVAFVAPYLPPTTLRFVRAALAVSGVRLGLVTHEPLERVPADVREALAGHWRIDNALDWRQLASGARGLAEQMGALDRLLGILEHLQVSLARVRDELGIPGLDAESALNFRDKARMKTLLREAGLPCARHGLVGDLAAARAFAAATGYPLVAKPPAGAGAEGTYRVDDDAALAEALGFLQPTADGPVLLEEFIVGEEHSFDSIFVQGKPVWHSLTRYLPTPLEVLRNSWIQWCVLLPREVDDPIYDDIREAAFEAVTTLGLETGLTHLEWFRRPDGSLAISEVAARPPGAQITTLISVAHVLDFYGTWSRLMIDEVFDPPQRRYAAGAAFLRGQGGGRVAAVHGIEAAQRAAGDLVVEVKLPLPGQPAATSYEGEGYVIVRHPETQRVEEALRAIVSTIRVELAE